VDPSHLEFVIVPGVAFDRRGGRIGYGKGYYDRLLARGRMLKIAAAFEVQVVDALPMAPHDVPMNLLITEAG
jgi:5-formyltetrahydrofolate cyclo-ligase